MDSTTKRADGRALDELRPVTIEKGFARAAKGSVLLHMGDTRVVCAASVDERVPPWMRAQGVPGGWVTAEYSMLPYASSERMRREASAGKVGGRTQEIQRLIGRSMRAVIDLEKLGPRSIWIDCDVIQADGGTRTASITGGFIAMKLAVQALMEEGVLAEDPLLDSVAAISVGVVDAEPMLDLCYTEDFAADVDMNVVMTGSGKYVEVQGTAEGEPYSSETLTRLLALADGGIHDLIRMQDDSLA